jgi:flotillin
MGVFAIPLFFVFLAFVLVVFIARRIRNVAPNEALIVVGRGAGSNSADLTDGQKVVIGGRTFVWPVIQKAFPVSLEQRQVKLTIEAVDSNFIAVAVRASVLFKIRGDAESVRRAAQRFLGQQDSLEGPLADAFEGALRPIIGSMTVRQLVADRETLAEKISVAIREDLSEQGLQIDLIKISDIVTPGSTYLQDLGRAEAAEARKNADVAEAKARLLSESEQIATAEQIAMRKRDLALKQAQIQEETDKALAAAQSAGPIAQAAQDRLIAIESQKALIEKAKATEANLDVTVRRPAEAEKYRAIQQAEATREANNAATEAEVYRRVKTAEADRLAAEALADAERAKGQAIADVRRLQGEAEGEAIRQEGLARAEATDAQARALQQQGEAVLMQQLIAVLPEIVAQAAAPMSNIDNLTVVSTEGASQLTKTVGANVLEGTNLLRTIVPGFDLGTMLNKFANSGAGTGAAVGAALGAAASTANASAPLALAVTPEATENFVKIA